MASDIPHIAPCRPVEWSAHNPPPSVLGLPDVPVYPGSVIWNCARCGTPIYVGPRVQEVSEKVPHLRCVCFGCGVLEAVELARRPGGALLDILNLNNPYRPR